MFESLRGLLIYYYMYIWTYVCIYSLTIRCVKWLSCVFFGEMLVGCALCGMDTLMVKDNFFYMPPKFVLGV